MLFSNPDYPLFLVAVFFLYALSRYGHGGVARWARVAVMVLLGDLVFVLVGKDVDVLWDPLGGALYRLVADYSDDPASSHPPIALLALHWAIGSCVLAAAIALGRRGGAWLASRRGQQQLARGIVVVLAALAAAVAIAYGRGELAALTAHVVDHGHLAVLLVLGVGVGAADDATTRPLGRVVILFVVSALFYQAWASTMAGPYGYLLALLVATIVLDYYLALWIERAERPAARKALVIVSLCSNLGILFFFKYTDFVAQDVLHLPVRRLHLILPAGISFHTFQSLSYTIDVYRKQLRATTSVVQFATFVLFFPQLVAGPIVRAQDLLPQLAAPPPLELDRATRGLYRVVVGLFKKIALADTLAITIVERVFEAPERFSAIEVLAGVYAYAFQIYLDFSAYSDIAIGSAQVLGFELPENFRTPYRSANLQEFWRRWHISLSTWLRDYLYVTLGGNRGAPWRTYANLTLTMLLGGLWHGASWTFVVWGALHGFGLAVTRYFQRATAGDPRAAGRLFVRCVLLAVAGFVVQRLVFHDADTWTQLVCAWLYATPLWAVVTAWLGADPPPASADAAPAATSSEGLPWRALWRRSAELAETTPPVSLRAARAVELLRIATCAAAVVFVIALQAWPSATWIPLVVVAWGLAYAADAVEAGEPASALIAAAVAVAALAGGYAVFTACELWDRVPAWTWLVFFAATWRLAVAPDVLAAGARRAERARAWKRAIAVVLVFHYVCLAWIFFRATSFDNALAVLRQLAAGELDHANLVPAVTTALAVGFACHFFADGSFRWLRQRFVALPPAFQGLALAGCALVLRELGHPRLVKFIYFQF